MAEAGNSADPQSRSPGDMQRDARVFFSLRAEAIIYPVLPSQQPRRCFVQTCDLSRSGIKIQHDAQLREGQQIDLLLGERPRRVEVVWCTRLNFHKYVIGCCFVKSESRPAPPTPPAQPETRAQSRE
jgi:PilZ domain